MLVDTLSKPGAEPGGTAPGPVGAVKHVEEIRGDQPAWLPANLRAQAQGEFTWLCLRCDSYPAMKWPHNGGASAALLIHLGKAHQLGQFRTTGMGMPSVQMIRTR